MCCKSEQSNNCFDKIFLVRIWKFTPVLVWLKALVRIHNLIQECLMFWFFWSDETHGDAEILGMQIWNFRYANMDFYKTSHIQIWFLGKDPVFKYEFLVLFSHPCRKVSLNQWQSQLFSCPGQLKSKIIRIKFLSIWGKLEALATSRNLDI